MYSFSFPVTSPKEAAAALPQEFQSLSAAALGFAVRVPYLPGLWCPFSVLVGGVSAECQLFKGLCSSESAQGSLAELQEASSSFCIYDTVNL